MCFFTDIYNCKNKNKIKINSDKNHLITFSYRKDIEVGRVKLGKSFIQEINCNKFLGLNSYLEQLLPGTQRNFQG